MLPQVIKVLIPLISCGYNKILKTRKLIKEGALFWHTVLETGSSIWVLIPGECLKLFHTMVESRRTNGPFEGREEEAKYKE